MSRMVITVKHTKEKNRTKHDLTRKNNTKEKHLMEKANNFSPIRVLYKKVGQIPEIKIIDNVFRLKKAIVENNLEIIPYEKLFIICHNQSMQNIQDANIALNLKSIYGDFILIKIDRKQREFKSLSQEDIMWYSKDLENKSYLSQELITLPLPPLRSKKEYIIKDLERCDSDNTNISTFENELISVLINIEMALSGLINENKNNKK